ncbi:hypothetical protein BATDEDRAFT_87481 [Batrachochytrium dendrobatidis JAM81]|uniref:Glycosyltransferase subfamily 4-like N-terminal domain-containing protein n=1 Tax=Batrachochytrium dendrobatidis (strain JAM81 / FGSC 10211) TaxID=684364 RepID=F4NZQ4_BATDJ|nr:uncharacterized protein BATDEDRAFT_87481 [Batrachochytrium dendrobatidis JAM81]EGF81530.1 hypothetical protein BATDEDRAFT_87481 [Batrachochytrium dendrobatidis JAM81]KAJ8325954.1 hypothetical protein O5D80_005596 [Batrachochytrium dendrobatidis]KAK5669731.1 hypothetical protein QVD99_004117 [Batrachochytrium dendrobatidis]|eukprot:XP_006678234.1 hypothetical protein BATDEDRAFT_87481 [Batrachochytrium dendrobatidis JAM81]
MGPELVYRKTDAVHEKPSIATVSPDSPSLVLESATTAVFSKASSRLNEVANESLPPLRILFATEYLPPYVSGIANRCKNLINGYRQEGHHVTVFSVQGTDCDVIVPSIVNPFYSQQRTFLFPPLPLLLQLLDFSRPVPYDIAHLVAPTCFSFIFILPLIWLRGIKMYVSYHVYLEYYKKRYFGAHPSLDLIIYGLFTWLYFLPLVWLATCVGIPSKTADSYVFRYAHRIHYLKSGLDTDVFVPQRVDDETAKEDTVSEHTLDDNGMNRPIQNNLFSGSSSSLHKMIETPVIQSDLTITNLRQVAGLTSDDQGPMLVYVGRLAVEKNVEFLVEAMGHPSMANATLVIVGDGPSRRSLQELSESVVGAEHVYSPAVFVAPATVANDGLIAANTTSKPNSTPFSCNSSEKAVVAKELEDELIKSPSERKSNGDINSATMSDQSAKTLVMSTPIIPYSCEPHPPMFSLSNTAQSPRKRVIFTGMIFNEHQVASYYGQCDIFVSASASETFGFTVAEAMACGTPAVVVRSGAFKTVYKMIDDWMFEEGGTEEYVGCVEKVWRGGRKLRRFSRDIAVDGFGVHAAVKDLASTYRWIIDGCPDPRV